MPPLRQQIAQNLLLAAATGSMASCASPLDRADESDLRHSIVNSAAREIREAEAQGHTVTTQREQRVDKLQLPPEVLAELERTTGPVSYQGINPDLGPSLLGTPQTYIPVNLQRVVVTTVQNNLGVQFARIAPAVTEQRITAAEAAFDWTVFANTQWQRFDEPIVQNGFGSPAATQNQQIGGTAGIRRRLTTGGSFVVQQQVGYNDNTFNQPFVSVPSPNPSNQSQLTLQLDQPLLRGFGTDANLAEVRIAQNAERDDIQQLKATLIQTVTDTETAYWRLVQTNAELQITKRLLQRGEEVLTIINARPFETKIAQRSDAVATVEQRRAEVIRAENNVRLASDRLKQLINDPELTVGGEVLLLPVDRPPDEPIRFSLLEMIAMALANRPEIQRAVLAIDDASIRQLVADNQRLPLLDLRAQTRFTGLKGNMDDALSQEIGNSNTSFISYLVGLNFEQQIGNRGPEAQALARRLEKSQAVIAYRDVVQRVVVDLKTQLRAIEASFRLIEQTRAARIAAAENVRALSVAEITVQELTPEFLDLKFRRQQALAGAEIAESDALTSYNTAIARLYGAVGTALERNRIKFEVPTASGSRP
ncbi:MAG: TolC family protein [Phycisphaerales bacterium]